MIKYIIITIGLGLGLVSLTLCPKTELITNTADLELFIELDTIFYQGPAHDRPFAQFKAEIRNNGNESVKLVMPGDGSQSGLRTPMIKWSAINLDKQTSYEHKFQLRTDERFCGMINKIKESEIINLEPGVKVLLDEWIGNPSLGTGAGKYAVKLSYENDPASGIKGFGAQDKHIMKRIKKTTPIKLISNEIVVEIEL